MILWRYSESSSTHSCTGILVQYAVEHDHTPVTKIRPPILVLCGTLIFGPPEQKCLDPFKIFFIGFTPFHVDSLCSLIWHFVASVNMVNTWAYTQSVMAAVFTL